MNRKTTRTTRLFSSAYPARAALSQALSLLLLLQACLLPRSAFASPKVAEAAPPRIATDTRDAAAARKDELTGGTYASAASTAQTFGVVLTPLDTEFRDHAGLDHHQPSGKLVITANAPAGLPHSFELVAADGAHAAFSNVAGITGGQRVAAARDDGQGRSLAGFAPGELFAGTGAPGRIARVSADGASVQNP